MFVSSEFWPVRGKNFVVAVYYVCECQTMGYCFVGKNFVVRLSTTKTMKMLPPRKIPAIRYVTSTGVCHLLLERQNMAHETIIKTLNTDIYMQDL